MGNTAEKVSLRKCPNCGLTLPASGWKGLCPRCLVVVSLCGSLPPVLSEPALDPETGEPEAFRTADPDAGRDTATTAFLAHGCRRLGDYQLLEEVGRGGMGVVFKARQLSLNRIVALKVLQGGLLADGKQVERFRAEAETVAQLQHPNIVAIHEAGQHEGVFFFSMEYVPGRTLANLVEQRPLSPDLAAQYLRTIAEAIHFAHARGIFHRDLKPSNVLIDSCGRLRVTDFGLAKRLDMAPSLESAPSDLTITGQVLGSPNYLAPEQVQARRVAIGPASDIYSLAAILFHLLTGRPPFLSDNLEGTLLQVLTTEALSVRRLNPAVPRDLDTICSKCLQKDPARRYTSAQVLADELGRFLDHQPILARPASIPEKLWRWCLRRPAVALILVLLHLSLATGLAGVLWQWHRAQRGEVILQQNLYAADVHHAQAALEDNNLGLSLALLQRYIPSSPREPDLRGFEWRYLWSLCRGDERATLGGDGSIISCVRFSPDGRFLASAGFDRTVTIREATSLRVIEQLGGLSGPLSRLALSFSQNGSLLAAAGGTNLVVWNTRDWSVVKRLEAHSAPLGGGAYEIAFTADGSGLAAGLNGNVCLWDTTTWEMKTVMRGAVDDQPCLLAYAADGKRAATFNDGNVRFWDTLSAHQQAQSDETIGQPFGLAFSPAGDWVAVPDTSGKVRLLDSRTGATVASLQAHAGFAQTVAFAPDGKTLATGGADQLVRLWNLDSLTNVATFKGHRSEVWAVAFSPDGQTLASGGKDGTVKLWKVRVRDAGTGGLVNSVAPLWFSPDGQVLLTRSVNGALHYWDSQTGRHLRKISPLQAGLEHFFTTVSADGKQAAISVGDGWVFLADLQSGARTATNRVDTDPANTLAFSPDNRLLALSTGKYVNGSWQGSTKILDLTTRQLKTLSTDYSGTRYAAVVTFSPNGKLLAGVGPNYTIRLWDLGSKKSPMSLKGHTWDILGLAFSPDGRLLASGGNDNLARLWDISSGSQIAILAGHKAGIIQLGFSPDGRTLATSGNDKTVRLWSVVTHREMLSLKSSDEWVHFLFSPDGHTLAAGGRKRPIEFWRAPEAN